jgi:hypothetical protein
MAIWIDGWKGDHAGKVVGRQTNRLLLSLTHSDASFPAGLFQKGDLGGVPWYFNLYVSCLTPGARKAIATSVDQAGDYVWSIEVAEVDWGDQKTSWTLGIHLFSAMLLAPVGHQSGTILTGIIDKDVKRIGDSVRSVGPARRTV